MVEGRGRGGALSTCWRQTSSPFGHAALPASLPAATPLFSTPTTLALPNSPKAARLCDLKIFLKTEVHAVSSLSHSVEDYIKVGFKILMPNLTAYTT